MMRRFTAKQEAADGKLLDYTVEYDLKKSPLKTSYYGSVFGGGNIDNVDTELQLFTFSFTKGTSWSNISNISIDSKYGDELLNSVRDWFFESLVISGIRHYETVGQQ